MDRKEFLTLYAVQLLVALGFIFGWSLVYLYFVELGFSYWELLLMNVLTYLASLLAIPVLRRISLRSYIRHGILLRVLTFLMVFHFLATPQLYLLAVVFGVMLTVFWIPCNIKYFRLNSGATAQFSGLYFFTWALMGALAPAIAGVVAKVAGYWAVFGGSIGVLLLAFLVAGRLGEETVDLDWRGAIAGTKGVRTLVFIEGFWQGVNLIGIPLFTLYFIREELALGAFLAYLGLLGALASLLVSRLSDRTRRRLVFIAPATILTAVFTILSGFSKDLYQWALFQGGVQFFLAILSPFAITVVIDASRDLTDSIVSREVFLDLGRVAGGVGLAASMYLTGEIRLAIIGSGLALLLYPLVLAGNGLYPSELRWRPGAR